MWQMQGQGFYKPDYFEKGNSFFKNKVILLFPSFFFLGVLTTWGLLLLDKLQSGPYGCYIAVLYESWELSYSLSAWSLSLIL